MLELFPKNEIVGVFRGFKEGGLEFHADLTLPYRARLHNVPMHGQFLLVQLENPGEAVLGLHETRKNAPSGAFFCR